MAAPAIYLTNIADGDVFGYPLLLLEGCISPTDALTVPMHERFLSARVETTTESTPQAYHWPIAASGAFKALVLLPHIGSHRIALSCNGAECLRVVMVTYQPPTTRFRVRFYYQKCYDALHKGFDVPDGMDNSDQAAIARIRLAALLLQTATAEMLRGEGLPRCSFAMDFAGDGLPVVRVLQSSFDQATATQIEDQELYRLVQRDIEQQGLDEDAACDGGGLKHAVILGCSRYDADAQTHGGHTALGGGKAALFGSCGLHAWPSHIGQVSACLLNNMKIDPRRLWDDSAFRNTHWANCSTGLGAFLHELGHCFGLGHSTSGIMARGIDDMHRLFGVWEADHHANELAYLADYGDGRLMLNHKVLEEVKHRRGAHWNRGSALQLVHSPWICHAAKLSSVGPNICWTDSVRGPVGMGEYDGQQTPFNPVRGSAYHKDLGGILIHAGQYLDRIETYSRAEVAAMNKPPLTNISDQHWMPLLHNEFITHVEVRAMAWIDGIRICTNLRNSQWFGGFGGQLHVLRPADGFKIHDFFGTRGDHHVGQLGVFCSPITADMPQSSASPSNAGRALPGTIRSEPVGLGLDADPHVTFSYVGIPIGAIVVKFRAFVESFRVISRDELCASTSRPAYGIDEHVFELAPGEFITKVCVNSGHWVDGLGFETNLRASPWFGGTGGSRTELTCPAGIMIAGFHGQRGANYVDSIGVYFSDRPSVHSRFSSFALLKQISSAAAEDMRQLRGLRGVLIALQNGHVMRVESYESQDQGHSLVQELGAFVEYGTELHHFALSTSEHLIQVDACVQFSADGPMISGVGFHTTTRCSSWFGTFDDDELRFAVAPTGHAILSIRGQCGPTSLGLVDVAGVIGPIANEVSTDAVVAHDAWPLVHNDSGSYDIRVRSQSSFGIKSVILRKKRGEEQLDQHAWPWQHAFLECPSMLCLPAAMLEHRIPRDEARTPREILRDDYAVGAIDTGGAFSSASFPVAFI